MRPTGLPILSMPWRIAAQPIQQIVLDPIDVGNTCKQIRALAIDRPRLHPKYEVADKRHLLRFAGHVSRDVAPQLGLLQPRDRLLVGATRLSWSYDAGLFVQRLHPRVGASVVDDRT